MCSLEVLQRGLDPTEICCETCTPPKPCLEAGRFLGEAVSLHQHQCLRIVPPLLSPGEGSLGYKPTGQKSCF